MRCRFLSFATLVFLSLLAAAQAGGAAYETVAFWHFGTEETSKLEAMGGVHRDQAGPRPPQFPDFEAENTAVKLDGRGAHFRFPDPGDKGPFDFDNGDAVTLEAWVNLQDIKSGENVYVIGKGRTRSKGFAEDNQNWALRVREVDGSARISFLFRSAATDAHKGDWHRWTSREGFAPGEWHHIAVSYTFGSPDSIRGWLDGQAVRGEWDMGGATKRPPVVDNDAIWIGSSQGGSPGNSFRGSLDEIAVHRGLVPAETLKARYRRVGPAPSVAKDILLPLAEPRSTQVLVTLHDGLAAHDRWPGEAKELPKPVQEFETTVLLFPRLPLRYDDWGIRESWKPTVMLRAVADVQFSAGKHRFLIRSRGGGRLWMNGKLIARSPFHKSAEGGYSPVEPVPQPPAPGARRMGFGDHEQIVEVDVPAGKHTLVFESLVGGKKSRAETGECCVAVQAPGEKQFRLLSPLGTHVWLTDQGWEAAAAEQKALLAGLDDRQRRAAAASQDGHWEKRHQHARSWTAGHPGPKIPDVSDRWPVVNEIDRFLAAKMERALVDSKAPVVGGELQQKAISILRENCFRCHGEKVSGGLRLNTRELALRGGESRLPAIVPGKPQESQLIEKLKAPADERMPPESDGLAAEQIAVLERWIKDGAVWPQPVIRAEEVTPSQLISDSAFLRRVYLDTVGVPPTADEARRFFEDASSEKRGRLIDQLLKDERFADHWVSYWQDVLAENPNILKPSLNNTGPFRYFLHDALRDDKPMDRFVSELVLMRGSIPDGGSAGFGMAADNDVPMAAKAHVLGTAFLGVELQCARCHDSPYHSTTQRELFQLAAMLDRKALTLPASSTVPAAFFEKQGRQPLIKASLRRGDKLEPAWSFPNMVAASVPKELLHNAADSRERLAAIITQPENTRFPQVLVNRVWKRLLGAGFVEPVHDWEGRTASHPELLDWLASELVAHDYQLKHVVRLILNSHAYQREPNGSNLKVAPERRFFAAPNRRRLTAEQIVDTLFAAAGKPMGVEEITFDADSRQPSSSFLNLGAPRRAWEFASLSNERDRPSLALPRAQAVTDVLEAFGWTASRQNPRSDRETEPSILQPGILSNGIVSGWISRLSDDTGLADVALRAGSPDEIADEVFLRFLTRLPNAEEKARIVALLKPRFYERRVSDATDANELPPLPRVSWAHHLREEATTVKFEYERRARAGDPPTRRLEPNWRERMEDVVWSVFNLPEFVWVP